MGETDIRNAWIAMGGLLTHVMSIAIVLRGNRWKHATRPVQAATTTSENVKPLAFPEKTPDRLKRLKSGNESELGVTSRLIVTATILNCWYFRFHIRDTIMLAMTARITQIQTSHPRPNPGGALLPYLVWLAWPLVIFGAKIEKSKVVLLISLFLSVGFPIEELVKNSFSKWKDPLSDNLYVF